MPKTNHRRDFKDGRDYTVPGGDFANAKCGARQQRKGMKEGVNRAKRSRQAQQLRSVVNRIAHDDLEADYIEEREPKQVPKCHDYKGKAVYVRY